MRPAPYDERLRDLLVRWEECRERGEKVSAQELCRDCPELLPELRRRIEALGAMAPVLRMIRPRPMAVAASAHLSDETRDLLRQRLRTIGLIILAGSFAFYVHDLVSPASETTGPWDVVFFGIVVLIQAMLVALVWSRLPLSLRQLRRGEVLFWGTVAVYLVWSQYTWMLGDTVLKYTDRGRDPDGISLIAYTWAIPWFALIVGYGTFIPNTWRRCGMITMMLALLPVAVTAAAGWTERELASVVHGRVLIEMTIWLAISVAVAVYGSHKISTLREEAFAARKLGQYCLKRQLGAGGMGEVYLAEHQLLRRSCAIKLIRPDDARDPQCLARFEREVQATATLTHWNTVEIYDYGRTDDGTLYYVMEYLPGLNLDQLVERFGPLPFARAVHLLRQVCCALREAHAIGLIHRDIKPNNVIICERGGVHDVVKLLDFGLVQQVPTAGASARLTMEGFVLGTPSFMSSEQAAGETLLDARSDIYSLGAVAYLLLTGRPPFDHDTAMRILAAHMNELPLPPSHFRADVPADLEALVLRCLEKNRARRFPDADTLEKALADCACAGAWTQAEAATWWREHRNAAAAPDSESPLPSTQPLGPISPI